MKNDDYITPEQRLNPKRPSSGDVLLDIRARLLIDTACAWRPTTAAQTNVAATMQAERERLAKGARKARRVSGGAA